MRKVCVVYDCKVEAYGNPFITPATGAAIRSFADEVNRSDKTSEVASHPEDFTLFEIGTYDETKGIITMYEAKKSLGTGIDFRRDTDEAPVKLAR